MKTILPYVTVVLLSFSCQKRNCDSLESAYVVHSHKMRNCFFSRWKVQSDSCRAVFISSISTDTSHNSNDIFRLFYDYNTLELLEQHNIFDSLYHKIKYVIVQSEIEQYFTNKKIYYTDYEIDSFVSQCLVQSYGWNDSLLNLVLTRFEGRLNPFYIDEFSPYHHYTKFYDSSTPHNKQRIYPDVYIKNKQVLYYTPHYDTLLNNYIIKSQTNKTVSEDVTNRMDFLFPQIALFTWDSNKPISIRTYPMIHRIIYDSGMQNAIIEFAFEEEGGSLLVRHIGSKWVNHKIIKRWKN